MGDFFLGVLFTWKVLIKSEFCRMTSISKRCFAMLGLCLTILAVKLSSAQECEENVCPYKDTSDDPEFCKRNAGRCFIDDDGMPTVTNGTWTHPINFYPLPHQNERLLRECRKTCLCANSFRNTTSRGTLT